MHKQVEGRNISATLNARPLVIATVIDEAGTYNACTAAWATPISHTPPMVALALRPASRTAQVIKSQGEVVLNTLNAVQSDLAITLGTSSGNSSDKHSLLKDIVNPSQQIEAPGLSDAVAHLECKLEQVISTGDHDLFILSVVYADSQDSLIDGVLYSKNTLLMLQRETFGLFTQEKGD